MQDIIEIHEIIVSWKFGVIPYYSYIGNITVYDESWIYTKKLYGTIWYSYWHFKEPFWYKYSSHRVLYDMYVGMCLLLLLFKPTISCDKWYYKSNTQILTKACHPGELSFKNFWKAFFNFMRRLHPLAW